jgi:hypothetical protein
VDVDYYVDMPHLLTESARPTLLYTFTPTACANSTGEESFTFISGGLVDMRVSGGARYVHPLWNYGTDCIVAYRFWNGIPYRASVYLVDRRYVSDHRSLVLLTPLARYNGCLAIVAWFTLAGQPLTRFNPTIDRFARMHVQTRDGIYVSTAGLGSLGCVTVPAEVDEAIAIAARNSSVTLNSGTVCTYSKDIDRNQAAILADYHRQCAPCVPTTVFPLEEAVIRYQFDAASYEPEAKSSLQAYMPPFLHGAFAPDQTLGNDKAAVKGRITLKQNLDMTISPEMWKYISEFTRLFLGDAAGTLVPVDMEDVYARQARPTQRRILDEANDFGDNYPPIVKTFLKKEAYAAPKDPRIISIINGLDKANYSRYTYALAEKIKDQVWYAFGLSPALVAAKVVKVCSEAREKIYKTDFHRLDGSISYLLRELERVILMAAFQPEYLTELAELQRTQYGCRCYTTFGEAYDSMFARLSGSPETALFNSIDNAFCAYVALRRTRLSGSFLTPKEAYKRLGLYGGDDGLTADVPEQLYVQAARDLGLGLEIEPVLRGQFGVEFLARVYGPGVWYGSLNSVTDIPRALSKFHTTVSLAAPWTPELKLYFKTLSLAVNDSNTPILGAICSTVFRLAPDNMPTPKNWNELVGWWAMDNGRIRSDGAYPNEREEWMDAYVQSVLPTFDRARFDLFMTGCCSLSDFVQNAPLCCEINVPEYPADVVINGVPPDRPRRARRPPRRRKS